MSPTLLYLFIEGRSETQRLLSLPTAQSNRLYYHYATLALTFPSTTERPISPFKQQHLA